jgi:hypothetical protein
MGISPLYSAGAFLGGLAITLALASWLTPRGWWRRPTARGLLILASGAWGFGSLLLHFAHAPLPPLASAGLPASFAPAARPPSVTASVDAAASTDASGAGGHAWQQPFRVHRDLNLRTAASVDAPRLATVPAGSTVTPTGTRHGDWWQVKALADGKENTGWVSSLWLRRATE